MIVRQRGITELPAIFLTEVTFIAEADLVKTAFRLGWVFNLSSAFILHILPTQSKPSQKLPQPVGIVRRILSVARSCEQLWWGMKRRTRSNIRARLIPRRKGWKVKMKLFDAMRVGCFIQ